MTRKMKETRRRLIKMGASVGITFPLKFLEGSKLKIGDILDVSANEIMILIKPVRPSETPAERDNGENR